ncbi:hypothetical protein AKJ41_03285 [candidate division MSBL1 archaeon SCGC-AAA259O05]|uniref:Uncharacterized protein n=1 Tax=candidate division MSBL1 archaeon SCGC-AAA259O05 TaxID=1698271 RepID=A0A133V3D4_9EURY|nr:hypothetical protein AKJ41_03285 [candidate division MSBL1 archaeon SCGC-AAA259O05]
MSKSSSRNVWEQLAAIFKYELLWNIRKKKFLASLIIVFGLASLQLFLPLIQGPLNPDPTFIIDNIWPPQPRYSPFCDSRFDEQYIRRV